MQAKASEQGGQQGAPPPPFRSWCELSYLCTFLLQRLALSNNKNLRRLCIENRSASSNMKLFRGSVPAFSKNKNTRMPRKQQRPILVNKEVPERPRMPCRKQVWFNRLARQTRVDFSRRFRELLAEKRNIMTGSEHRHIL